MHFHSTKNKNHKRNGHKKCLCRLSLHKYLSEIQRDSVEGFFEGIDGRNSQFVMNQSIIQLLNPVGKIR